MKINFFVLVVLILRSVTTVAQSTLLWYEDPIKISPLGTNNITYVDCLDDGTVALLVRVHDLSPSTYIFGDSAIISTGYQLVYYNNRNKLKKHFHFNHASGIVDFVEQKVSTDNYTYIRLLSLHGVWCINGVDTVNYPTSTTNNDEQVLIAYDSLGNYVNHISNSTSGSYSTFLGFDHDKGPIMNWKCSTGLYSYFTVYSKDLTQIKHNYYWITNTIPSGQQLRFNGIVPISNNQYILHGSNDPNYDIDPSGSVFNLGSKTNSAGIFYAICDSNFSVLSGKYLPDGIMNIRELKFFPDKMFIYGNYQDSISLNTTEGPITLPTINNNYSYYIINSDLSLNIEWARYITKPGMGIELANVLNSVKNRMSPTFTFNMSLNDQVQLNTNLNINPENPIGSSIIQVDTAGEAKFFGSFERVNNYDMMWGRVMIDDSTMFTANQFLFQIDASLNEVPDWRSRPDSTNSGSVMAKYQLKKINLKFIKGRIIGDLNSNYIIDSTDAFIPRVPIFITQDSTNTLSRSNGEYTFAVDTGNFTISASNITNFNSCSPFYNYATLTDSMQVDTGNVFFYTPENFVSDLEINGIMPSTVRVGTDFPLHLNLSNIGTVTTEALVKIFYDNTKCNFVSADLPPVFIGTDSIYFNFPSVKPFQQYPVKLIFNTYTNVTLGDSLKINVTAISTLQTDVDLNNNVTNLSAVINGSYDPNEKQSSVGEFYPHFDVDSLFSFRYNILFQNTGNDTAFKVILIDTLDAKLNPLTLKNLSSSHNYSASIINNRILKIEFDNIQLPDSGTNLIESQGYFSFAIQPKFPVYLNEQIKNRASILFDYNEPVLTNEKSTTFISYASIDAEKLAFNLKIFPNPAFNYLTIENLTPELTKEIYFHITDQYGQLVFPRTKIASTVCNVPINNFSSGMYLITFTNWEGLKQTRKFIKF